MHLFNLTTPGHAFGFCLVTRAAFLPSPPAAPTGLPRRLFSLSRLILSSSEDANPIPEKLGSAFFFRLRGAFPESSDDDLQQSTISELLEAKTTIPSLIAFKFIHTLPHDEKLCLVFATHTQFSCQMKFKQI
jgi:hypothetical protein